MLNGDRHFGGSRKSRVDNPFIICQENSYIMQYDNKIFRGTEIPSISVFTFR